MHLITFYHIDNHDNEKKKKKKKERGIPLIENQFKFFDNRK